MKNGVGAFMRQASKNYSALSSEEKDELANVSSATSATEGSSRAAARIFNVIHKKHTRSQGGFEGFGRTPPLE